MMREHEAEQIDPRTGGRAVEATLRKADSNKADMLSRRFKSCPVRLT